MTATVLTPSRSIATYSQRFRPAANRVNLTADQRSRQARVMALAWNVFRSRDGVMQFFNQRSDRLDARPLDLALSSDEGLKMVEGELSEMRDASPGTSNLTSPV